MTKKILVLSSADSQINREINNDFVTGIALQLGTGVDIAWAYYGDIGYHFNNGKITAFWASTGHPFGHYDFVYVKSYYRFTESALVLVEYFKQEGTKLICSELEGGISFSKLSQYARLTHAGLPIPETVFIPHARLADNYSTITDQIGLPFILKAIDAKGGGANFLIHSQEEFTAALKQHAGEDFVAQVFIPNDSDLRILVLGGKIELIIKRQRADASTHLNNTSQGGGASLLAVDTLDEASRDIALQAARLLKREVAGVDLMFASDTGKPYILEVNASPQVASGAFVAEKVEKYGNFFKNMLQ